MASTTDKTAARRRHPARINVVLDRLRYRIVTFRVRPLPLARHCIGPAIIAVLLLAGLPAVSGQSADTGTPSLSRINSARAGRAAGPLESNAQLDGLAAQYLADMLERRALTPAGYGDVGNRRLSEDVASAIGNGGYRYRYTGVVAAYGESVNNALDVAVGTIANRPALLEPAMSQAGIASGEIPAGEPWFAPPPGGFGRDIELTGMTVVVIVTAGEFRAVD